MEKKAKDRMLTIGPGDLTRNEFRQICRMLGEAFFDYPFASFAFPDRDMRWRRIHSFFELMLRYGLLYGEVNVTSRDFEGVVVWLPPEAPYTTTARMIRAGALKSIAKAGIGPSMRILSFSSKLEEVQRKEAPFPHWFGLVIGVHPDHQRKGLATLLLNHKVAQADRAGEPIYFETQDERNVRLYQSKGFEIVGEFEVPGSGIKSTTLLRQPHR